MNLTILNQINSWKAACGCRLTYIVCSETEIKVDEALPVRCIITLQNKMNKGSKLFDYDVGRKLGAGSFGEVLLATKGGQKYAIKKISKKQVIKVNKLHEPFIEKQILYRLNDLCSLPYFVKIHQTESDDQNIYLVLEFCSGGTLEDFALNHNLDSPIIKKMAAKILLIMEKLHSFGIVHRDLKPSNFLLTEEGLIKLSDFGTAYAPDSLFPKEVATKIRQIKEISQKNVEKERKGSESPQMPHDRRSTFVGTACYMAPELLSNDICGKEADIWAFGCILFELIFKKSPFFDTSEGMVWKKILNNQILIEPTEKMKDQEIIISLIDLIRKILVKQIEKRIGYGESGYSEIKKHPFFQDIDWQAEANKPIAEIVSLLQSSKQDEEPQKPKERVILSGVVGKKAFFGNFKERMLILYSTPKLVYYCTETGQKKGEIQLDKQTPVAIEGKIFSVTNEKKTYFFKSKTSTEWTEMIRNAILNAFY